MFTRRTILCLGLIFFVGLPVFAVGSQGPVNTPSTQELQFLQLINQARENPLAVASSLGMDTDQILEDIPDLQDILREGLPPLIFNDNLYAAASAHTGDMLENGYFSYVSLDGRTYYDRIVESGYDPVATGESLGMLGFTNFIAPGEAVDLIFENIFRDELNPARTEKRNILDPDLEEVGIAFGPGTFRAGGFLFNVYLVTCDFATSAISVLELEFLELINQARENPLAMASSLGMDTDQILEDLPELREILTEGLPPLTFNKNLYAAATAHAWDMLLNGYYSHDSLDGRTWDDRIRESGYMALAAGEIMRLLVTVSFVESAEGARTHFERFFKRELNADYVDRNILNPALKEVGISFAVASPDMWEESSSIYSDYYTLLLVGDFAASVTQEMPYLKGWVYEDLDRNGLYGQGEGVPGVVISVEGPDTARYLFTNQAGGFMAPLEPGPYRIVAYCQEGPVEVCVEMAQENQAVAFKIEVDSGD
ncbi:MAG: hypothetical protein KAV83_10175 [Desulfobacterales bacterium]|nr:hypothetical protein [Desulfobacterales bacterium]